MEFGVLWNDKCMLIMKMDKIKFHGEITLIVMTIAKF